MLLNRELGLLEEAEENPPVPRAIRLVRPRIIFENIHEELFLNNFRLTKQQFQDLKTLIEPYLTAPQVPGGTPNNIKVGKKFTFKYYRINCIIRCYSNILQDYL